MWGGGWGRGVANDTVTAGVEITFADILKKKTENEMNSITEEQLKAMTPEEYLEHQRAWPTGPEYEGSSAAGS